MTKLQVNTRLPLAETPGQNSPLPGGKQSDDSRAQAWRREMERAQLDGWLAHGVLRHHGRATAAQAPSVAHKTSVSPAIPPVRAATRSVLPSPAVPSPASTA